MANKKPLKLRCECGGLLRSTRLARFDFTGFVGAAIKITLEAVPGLRCTKCGRETLSGEVIDIGLCLTALTIIQLEVRLKAPLARYLRRYLGFTQQQIADRLSVNRVTVANWETADENLSPTHDLNLRALVLSELVQRRRLSPGSIFERTAQILGHVRSLTTDSFSVPPIVVADYLDRAKEKNAYAAGRRR